MDLFIVSLNTLSIMTSSVFSNNESVNVASATSVELVNVELLSGLMVDSPAVEGLDVSVSSFRSSVLMRYNVIPFGSFADWSVSDEGLAYRLQAEQLAKGKKANLSDVDKKKVASVLVSAYDRLKKAWDDKENKRVVSFSVSDMVSYIARSCDNEFKALVGCSVSVVPTSPLVSWSLIANKFTKKDDLIQTVLTSDNLENASVVLSALLSYKHRFIRLTDEVAKESAKVARSQASINDAASKSLAVGVGLDDFLLKCRDAYLAAVESSKKSALDADKLRANIERLKTDLTSANEKLDKAIKDKRTAAVKKNTADVVRLERQISDAVRVLQVGGCDVFDLV